MGLTGTYIMALKRHEGAKPAKACPAVPLARCSGKTFKSLTIHFHSRQQEYHGRHLRGLRAPVPEVLAKSQAESASRQSASQRITVTPQREVEKYSVNTLASGPMTYLIACLPHGIRYSKTWWQPLAVIPSGSRSSIMEKISTIRNF